MTQPPTPEAARLLALADAWVVAAMHKALSIYRGITTAADPDAARAAFVDVLASQSRPVDEATERERFEAWMLTRWHHVPRIVSEGAPKAGEYSDQRWQEGLEAWLAAKADMSTPAPGWRPIDSAPKDGRCLLAINTDDGYEFGVLLRDKKGNWIHDGEPTFCHSYYYEPTHWQPLPNPPAESTDGLAKGDA